MDGAKLLNHYESLDKTSFLLYNCPPNNLFGRPFSRAFMIIYSRGKLLK